MAVNSQMLDLGTPLPEVKLPDTDGRMRSFSDFDDAPVLVVVFLSKHCPYVQHVRPGLIDLARRLAERGVAFVGVAANDWDAYPADAPDEMGAEGYPFPILMDGTQEAAKAFHAACTPDFFVFDGERRLAYRGQMDDSRPGNDTPVDGRDLQAAVTALLAGEDVPAEQRPSVGCGIKWRPGNDPNYAALS